MQSVLKAERLCAFERGPTCPTGNPAAATPPVLPYRGPESGKMPLNLGTCLVKLGGETVDRRFFAASFDPRSALLYAGGEALRRNSAEKASSSL